MQSGRGEISKANLEEILTNNCYGNSMERVKAMQLKGKYQLDTNSKSFEAVLQKYFIGSLAYLKKVMDYRKYVLSESGNNRFAMKMFAHFERKSKCDAYELIGKYADREYTQVTLCC